MRRTVLLALLGVAVGIDVAVADVGAALQQEADVPEAALVHVCARQPHVVVRASKRADAEAACEGATRALDFLARVGMEGPPSTTIDIVPELPGDLAGRAVGCYVRKTQRVLLLSFDAFQAGGGWLRMPPGLELYRAAASHEMAHAVMGCRSAPGQLAVAAYEYVAYVVLFATMDPQLRASLLARFPGAGFQNDGQISDINHLVDPNRFAVDSWRHFLKAKDREGWLKKVISGEVVPLHAEDPEAASR